MPRMDTGDAFDRTLLRWLDDSSSPTDEIPNELPRDPFGTIIHILFSIQSLNQRCTAPISAVS